MSLNPSLILLVSGSPKSLCGTEERDLVKRIEKCERWLWLPCEGCVMGTSLTFSGTVFLIPRILGQYYKGSYICKCLHM